MNLHEEDSSGSEAGSEVSFGSAAAETDRFGFILVNGSTAGNLGPPPEVVRQREVKWINIISQWDRILLKNKSKIKEQCQKGIPASLRAKCWPLLCGAAARMKHNTDIYKSLDSKPALQSWVEMIERDLDRQFPFHEMFLSKDGHGQRGLFRVLKAYTQYQPDEGYCQAQGPVAAVLLMNMPTEETFWCLVQISEHYLPGYYSPLLEGVLFDAAMLTWVLKRTCPAIHRHLQHHGVEPLMYATDWLMCLFTRHLPFNTLLRVWDLFFCYGVRVLFQVAVVLVRTVLGRAEQRRECQGQMETLERLRGVREHVQPEDDSFIAEVCAVPLSKKDLKRQTEKELDKWRIDRPASTFDPRERCHGYRMVWERERAAQDVLDKRARESGNLSVPLVRSPSSLSLSPSLLRKKWRKAGKFDEWESGAKVQRNFSMVLSDRRRDSWLDSGPTDVQPVEEEEDVDDAEGTFEATVPKPEETPEAPEEQRRHIPEERKELQETGEQAERSGSADKSTEAEGGRDSAFTPSKETQSLDKAEGGGGAELSQGPDECRSSGEDGGDPEDASHHEPSTNKQEGDVGCISQMRDIEPQNQEQLVENRCRDVAQEVTSTQVAESENVVVVLEEQTNENTDTSVCTETQAEEHRTEVLEKQTDSDSDKATELEAPTQAYIEMQTKEAQSSPEKDRGSQMDRCVEAVAVKPPYTTQDTWVQQGQDAITQTEESLHRDTLRDPDAEPLADIKIRAESLGPAERENNNEVVNAQERVAVAAGPQEVAEIGAQPETHLVSHHNASSLQETNETRVLAFAKCIDTETLTGDLTGSQEASETQIDTEGDTPSCSHTPPDDTPKETLTHPVKTDEPSRHGDAALAEPKTTLEPDGTGNSLESESAEKPAAQPAVSPDVEQSKTEDDDKTIEEQDAFTSPPSIPQLEDIEACCAAEQPSEDTQPQDTEDGSGAVEEFAGPDECQSTGEDRGLPEDTSLHEPSANNQEGDVGCNGQSQGETQSTTEPAEPKDSFEPDGTGNSLESESAEKPAAQPAVSPDVEQPKTQDDDKTMEEQDAFTSPPSIPQLEDIEACCAAEQPSEDTQPQDTEDGSGAVEEFPGPDEYQSTGEDRGLPEDTSLHEPSANNQEGDVGCNGQSQGETQSTTEPAEPKYSFEPDGTGNSLESESAEEPAAQPAVSPDVEQPKTQDDDKTMEEQDAFTSPPSIPQLEDIEACCAAEQPSEDTQPWDTEDGSGAVEEFPGPDEYQSTGEDRGLPEDTSLHEPSANNQEGDVGCNGQSQGETQSTTEPAAPKPTVEPDGTGNSLESESAEKPAAQPAVSPDVEQPKTQDDDKTMEEQDAFTSPPSIPQLEDKEACCAMDGSSTTNNPQLETSDSDLPEVPGVELDTTGLIQAVGPRISSTDFCVRKSLSSHGSRLTHRLSEDLFTAPQLSIPSPLSPPPSQSKDNVSEPNPVVINAIQTGSGTTSLSPQPNQDLVLSVPNTGDDDDDDNGEAVPLQEVGKKDHQVPPREIKRFGLFRRLRGEQPKQAKDKGAAKIPVPKILIQDFSDGVGKERTLEDVEEEKISSRERRRRKREQERREKEEEKLRKKREKEIEKEKLKEKRRTKTQGKGFSVQPEQRPENPACSDPYVETYF